MQEGTADQQSFVIQDAYAETGSGPLGEEALDWMVGPEWRPVRFDSDLRGRLVTTPLAARAVALNQLKAGADGRTTVFDENGHPKGGYMEVDWSSYAMTYPILDFEDEIMITFMDRKTALEGSDGYETMQTDLIRMMTEQDTTNQFRFDVHFKRDHTRLVNRGGQWRTSEDWS